MRIEEFFESKKTFNSAKDVVNEFRPNFENLEHEELWVLFTNSKNVGLKKMLFSIGNHNSTIVDNRRIIKEALFCNAAGIILVHNHPSGNMNPSNGDIKATETLSECCKLFEIQLLDHIIVGEESFFSFSDEVVVPV